MRRGRWFWIMLLGLTLQITGCWDQVELDKRAIIVAVAIDKAEETDMLKLTLQTVIPSRMTTPMRGGGEKKLAVQVVSVNGRTILDALRIYKRQINATPYFQTNRLLIVGEELAREGVKPFVDFFIRNPESQTRAWVLVSQGKAVDILKWRNEANQIPADYIGHLIDTRSEMASFVACDIHHFVVKIAGGTTSPVASGIKVMERTDGQSPGIQVFGTAVFKKDRLAGWLNMKETRGFLWITRGYGHGMVEIDNPGKRGLKLVQENIRQHKSKITTELKGGRLAVRIGIKEEGNIGELEDNAKLTTPNAIAAIERKLARVIQSEVRACLGKCQKEYKADIFGFGEAVQRQHPKAWTAIHKNWEQRFSNLPIEITVKAKVKGIGMIDDPINLQ